MEEVITKLCERLQCSICAADIERLKDAQRHLSMLQQRDLFTRIATNVDFTSSSEDSGDLPMRQSISELIKKPQIHHHKPKDETIENTGEEMEICTDFPEDSWNGYFRGFEMLNELDTLEFAENKKCIELCKGDCELDFESYLRVGVRSFVIDLFSGTKIDNQAVMVRLHQAELNVSKECGFPVQSTIMAKLTPRYQYTGIMYPPDAVIELKKSDKITLTTDRSFSTRGSREIIYVNARFLLVDVKLNDFILIGYDIQVKIDSITEDELKCCIVRGGQLKSRMPVLFPRKCEKFRMSLEEIEDITFAKEVGITIIVSHIAGSMEYFKDLERVFKLLECEKIHIFARVVLNDIKGCDGDMNWVAEKYDGFVIDLSRPENPDDIPALLHLCPDAECFMKLAYTLNKPIIFDPAPIADQTLRVDPIYYMPIFYYPDKYIIRCGDLPKSNYFCFLQKSISDSLPLDVLSEQPYCDKSITGSDTLARSIVIASIEMNASAIIVCGIVGRMTCKISHFRPKVPIIFVTCMKSAATYISMHHNVIMLCFRGGCGLNDSHYKAVYKKVLFGIAFLRSRKLLHHNDNIILVYDSTAGTKVSDKFVTYKFDKSNFAEHLSKTLFV